MRIEQMVYETLPAGQYAATLMAISEKQGQWGTFAKFTFQIDDPRYEGITVTGAASAQFSSRSKLYKWTRAIFGGYPIPKDYVFESGDLLGRRCMLILEVVEDDEGGEYNRVESIFPVQQQPRPAQAAPAPVAAGEVPWPDVLAPPPDYDEIPF